jgi:hypothetical protein
VTQDDFKRRSNPLLFFLCKTNGKGYTWGKGYDIKRLTKSETIIDGEEVL